MRCRVQRASGHVYAILVARTAGLGDDGGWDAECVYWVHAPAARGHPASCAAQGWEGAEGALS
jgi:hypothetical protein